MPQTLNKGWKLALGDNWETIQDKWLHTISNLTLSAYNYNYSNKSFADKKSMENGFEQSGLRLNQYIAKFEKWGEEELEQRKEKLSEMALKIWAYPVTTFVPIQKEDDVVALYEDNDTCTGRKIQYFIFQGDKQDVNDWADMMWEMVSKLFVMNPAILYQEAKQEKNVWFDTKPVSKHYKKMAEGLYYCPSSSSTWTKMSIMKNLFRLYHLEEDELSFGLYPQKEDVEK